MSTESKVMGNYQYGGHLGFMLITQFAPISCNVVIRFHFPDIHSFKMIYDDKCLYLVQGISLTRAFLIGLLQH